MTQRKRPLSERAPETRSMRAHDCSGAAAYALDDLAPDRSELVALRAFRWICVSESQGNNAGWNAAFNACEEAFGGNRGPVIAGRIAGLMRALRRERSAMFEFMSPACPGCSRSLTASEYQLLAMLKAARRQDPMEMYRHAVDLTACLRPHRLLGAVAALAGALPVVDGERAAAAEANPPDTNAAPPARSLKGLH